MSKGMAQFFVPREHGATAMLLTPFFAAAILLRRVQWPELFALVAIAAAFTIKEPLVVLARQRFVWKQQHDETRDARRAAAILGIVLLGSGAALVIARGFAIWIPVAAAVGVFGALAIAVNVRNKQRSEWFQVASAAALSATSLAASVSALGRIPKWCWMLWMLCTLQCAAGIFVVHARLDARIAARGAKKDSHSRRAAFIAQAVVIAAAIGFAAIEKFWIAAALALMASLYLYDLRRQTDPASLQKPLKAVGLQALAQSIVYALILIAGLARY